VTYFEEFRQRVGELVLLSFIVGFQVLAGGQMCPRHEVGFNWIQNLWRIRSAFSTVRAQGLPPMNPPQASAGNEEAVGGSKQNWQECARVTLSAITVLVAEDLIHRRPAYAVSIDPQYAKHPLKPAEQVDGSMVDTAY
jgi:hypothetical protein